MDFSEKLQKLRTEKGLTQEELGEKLYVSRAAVSKWESGRGYPNLDSLKQVARFFGVTVDELIGGEEMLSLAENTVKSGKKKSTALFCAVLDLLAAFLLFIPSFGVEIGGEILSVGLLALSGLSLWQTVAFYAVTLLTILNGVAAAVICNLEKPVWDKHRVITGLALSVFGTLLFILSRQPYAGAWFLVLLLSKLFFIFQSK